jgi:hypothetical protein
VSNTAQVTNRSRRLIDDIETGLQDDNVSTTALLRKCVFLGGHTGSAELRDWATKELKGYGREDELPRYRRIGAPICIDAVLGYNIVKGQIISPSSLPEMAQEAGLDESVRLTVSVAQLEDMARQDGDSIKLMLPGGSILMNVMSASMDEFEQITALYWNVSKTSIRGVVDQVRTALAELIAELVATAPDERMTPPKEAADQAVRMIVTGRRNTVNLVNAQASEGGTNTITPAPTAAPPESFFARWRKRGIVVGIATVAAAVFGLLQWMQWMPWQ